VEEQEVLAVGVAQITIMVVLDLRLQLLVHHCFMRVVVAVAVLLPVLVVLQLVAQVVMELTVLQRHRPIEVLAGVAEQGVV
jgi:hypothetical protein